MPAKELPGATYKLISLHGFLDGNVYPRRVERGEMVTVDWQTYRKMVQSDPDGWIEDGIVLPPPTTSEAEPKGEDQRKTDEAEPQDEEPKKKRGK